MSVILKSTEMHIKNSNTNEYQTINVIAEQTADEVITRIEDAKAETENSINVAASRAMASIPSDYTELYNAVVYGNVNQLIKNPFVSSASSPRTLGGMRLNRCTYTWDSEHLTATFTRTTGEIASWGPYWFITNSGEANNAGHKWYIRLVGLDHSGVNDFSFYRVVSSSVTGAISETIREDGDYAFIEELTDNVEIISLLVDVGTAPQTGEFFKLESLTVIDLTEMFGVGNEPSIDIVNSIYGEMLSSGIPYRRSATKLDTLMMRSLIETYAANTPKEERIISAGGQDADTLKNTIRIIQQPWVALKKMYYERHTDTQEHYDPGTYRGIMYSSLFTCGRDVFYNRNINTYFSAIMNPASTVYQDNITKGEYFYNGINYGCVCTSLTGWLMSQEIYRTTGELRNSNGVTDHFKLYEYNGPRSIRVGDCMITDGHIKIIFDIEVRASDYEVQFIDVADTQRIGAKIERMTVSRFESFLVPYGGTYYLGRYEDAVPREVDPVRFATDIIPDMGDQTYYYVDDDIWVYIPDENVTTIYYRHENSSDYTSISKYQLPVKTVNDVYVYNVKGIVGNTGMYYFTTDPENTTHCRIELIDVGHFERSNRVITIENYSTNVTPMWYQEYVYVIDDREEKYTTYPAPEGYRPVRVKSSKGTMATPIEGNTITVKQSTVNNAYGFGLRVYFRTTFGQAYADYMWHV